MTDPSVLKERTLAEGSHAGGAQSADQEIQGSDDYRDEVVQRISSHEVLLPKHFFGILQGVASWLQLTRQSDSGYNFYGNSLAVLRAQAAVLVDHVVAASGTAQINLIDVGCGDGIKGNILLREFAKRLGGGQVVSYFPLDISGTLIDEAVNNALDGIDPGHFFVQPFTSDHRHLKELQLGRGPRLFAVLGNTAGNADERQVMTAISQAMVPGDLVLIEANIGKPDANDPIWRNPARMAFNFAPLATLGVPFDPARMRITLVEGQSIAEGTRSILTSYVEVEIDGKVIDEVKLYFVHYYNQHSLVPAIEREMNVETLWSHSAGDVCLVLGEAAG